MSRKSFPDLDAGEYTVIRGGFGGGAKWVWAGFLGLTFLALLVTSLIMLIKGTAKTQDLVSMATILPLLGMMTIVPWLRSGGYMLTNRRFVWRPTIGKPRETPLSEIAKIQDVNPNTSSIRLLLRDGSMMKVRNVGAWKRLWSALLLYRTAGMERALPPVSGQVSHLAFRAPRQQGRTGLQNGTLVFRPESAWYLPDAAVLNMLGEALGGMFKGQHTVQPELPTVEYVRRLAQGSDADFETRVGELCERLNGLSFAPGKVSLTRKKMALRKSHDVIRVSSPTGVLQKGVERSRIDALGWFDRWLQA
jgi:hypothetical protein